MSTPSMHETTSSVAILPCAFPADPPPDSQPLPHDTAGAKDVLHHAAEAYIDTDLLDQVEHLIEGVGSRATHYVPQAVAGAVSNYWFGTSRSSPMALPAGTSNWTTATEDEKGQTSDVNTPTSSYTRRIKQCANLPLVLLSSLVIAPAAFALSLSSRPLHVRLKVAAALTAIYSLLAIVDQSTSTPAPTDVDSEFDDPDFVVVATSGSSSSDLADDVSKEQPNGGISPPDVATPPPRSAVAPEDEPELLAPMPDPEREYWSLPSPQDDVEVGVTEAVLTPLPESPVVESSRLPESAPTATSRDEAVVNPPSEHAPMPDAEFEFVYYPSSSSQDAGDDVVGAHVLASAPKSAHESLPLVVPAQLSESAVFQQKATSAVVTEYTQTPCLVTEEDESAAKAIPGSVPVLPVSPQPQHNEKHTDTSLAQAVHGVDHDAVLSLRENAPEDELGSTFGEDGPVMQDVRGRESREALSLPSVTDAGKSNLPASAPTTPSRVTNGSTDKPYHPAELLPMKASYPTAAKPMTAIPSSLGYSSPSPSMREKGTHGHFHKQSPSTVSLGSGSVHGRKKVGFFDKVRGEAKVIIGKIEHKKEMVDAGKRILHGEV